MLLSKMATIDSYGIKVMKFTLLKGCSHLFLSTLREKSSFHTKETYRKPAGNPGFTCSFHLVSILATPSFPVVSLPWKALTAQIPEWKPRGNHWKPGVARQETPWKPLETWGCQSGNHMETRMETWVARHGNSMETWCFLNGN